MACNTMEYKGWDWTVSHIAELAFPKPRKNYPWTKTGWCAHTSTMVKLAEGCATREEALEKGLQALKALVDAR